MANKKEKQSVPATPLTVTLKLDGKERFVFPSLLPVTGSRFKLNMSKEIAQRVEVKPEEMEEYGAKRTQVGVSWNDEKIKAQKPFKFQMSEIKLIQENIKKLDEDEKLNVDNLDLAERLLAVGKSNDE